MADLSGPAVDHLWPVLQIVGSAFFLLVSMIIGLWRGFRWLNDQITKTAQALLAPLAKDLAAAEKSTKKAHKRISKLRSDLNLPPDHMDEYETQE